MATRARDLHWSRLLDTAAADNEHQNESLRLPSHGTEGVLRLAGSSRAPSVPFPLLPARGQRPRESGVRGLPRVGGARARTHVVTCFPSHPRGVLYPGWRRRWHGQSEHEGIKVHRVPTVLGANRGVLRRTLNYLSFVPATVWRAVRLGRFDGIVATSPQFFCAVAGGLAGGLKGTPWVFDLRDLWPDSIVAVGAVRSSPAIRLVEKLELALYRHARGGGLRKPCLHREPGLAGHRPREARARAERDRGGVLEPARGRGGVESASRSDSRGVHRELRGDGGNGPRPGHTPRGGRRSKEARPEVRFLLVGDGAETGTASRSARARKACATFSSRGSSHETRYAT